MLDEKLIAKFARDEATDRETYLRLAKVEKNKKYRDLLLRFADDEAKHHVFWSSILGRGEVRPNMAKVFFFVALRILLGAMFTVRVLERGEHETIRRYRKTISSGEFPDEKRDEVEAMINDELSHEEALLTMLYSEDERVKYMGSIILGLNDALVELTGGLAGLTSAISNTVIIGFSGLIVGIAASLSMAASNYLSTEASIESNLRPFRAALYTGMSYIFTVLLLVAPFFILTNRFTALAISLMTAFSIIAMFSYYSSVVFNKSFKNSLLKMAALGLGVAAVTYVIGRIINLYLGIEI